MEPKDLKNSNEELKATPEEAGAADVPKENEISGEEKVESPDVESAEEKIEEPVKEEPVAEETVEVTDEPEQEKTEEEVSSEKEEEKKTITHSRVLRSVNLLSFRPWIAQASCRHCTSCRLREKSFQIELPKK